MSAGSRPLRRKLFRVFAVLGVLGLLLVGVAGYTIVQWQQTEDTLSRHYVRSLRLQEVRALAFEAFTVVPASVRGEPDARAEYADRLEPLGRAFDEWAALVEDDGERAQVAAVREAAGQLDAGADRVLDLVEGGQQGAAEAALDDVETAAVQPFQDLTAAAVESDRDKRRALRDDADAARATATLTLAVAGAGVVSLLLLVGAYLTGGVFTPVRRLRDALRAVNRGEAPPRLPEDGDDEIAEVNREYNALVERSSRRRAPAAAAGTALEDASLVLRRMVAGLRDDTAALPAAGAAPEAATALLARVDAVEATLDQLGSLTYPVDLQPAPVEPAALLHDVLERFADEVVRRSVSTGIEVDPDTGPLLGDRARLREAVGELGRHALGALPPRGGRLRLRAVPVPGEDAIAVEVEDDGGGLDESDIAWLYDGSAPPASRRGSGLRLATSVVEQHGGRLQLRTVPGGGTTAVLLLPTPRPVPRPADRQPAPTAPAPEETR